MERGQNLIVEGVFMFHLPAKSMFGQAFSLWAPLLMYSFSQSFPIKTRLGVLLKYSGISSYAPLDLARVLQNV